MKLKKAETSLFRPFSVFSIQAPAGAARQSNGRHQLSHPGFDPDLDSWIASSWYQLPLQMVSFTRGVFWSMEDWVSPERRPSRAARPPIGNW
jgi:hypothetical protein